VESQHADLKRYPPSTNSSLTRIVGYIDDVVVKHESHIKKCFEESRKKTTNNHKKQDCVRLNRPILTEA
ncbi:hypothetical protein M8C21_009321, partial [Ambrosia artemisiifolia]